MVLRFPRHGAWDRIGAAATVWHGRRAVDLAPPEIIAPTSPRERLTWIALAFVPSSLLLGVTTYITADVAAAPLL
jgi:hypothetical protein